MTRAAGRFASLSRDEVLWRARVRARIFRDRAAVALRMPEWRRDTLHEVLRPELADVAPRNGRAADWVAVHRALLQVLRRRPTAFVLDPHETETLRAAIRERWPDAPAEAAARASRILDDAYDLLGYRGLSFRGEGGSIDWHVDPVHGRRAPKRFWADVPYLDARHGDHKVIWELNRHQHWMALTRSLVLSDDERCARAIVEQLSDWLETNPPLVGINWASMLELAFRALSWCWALHALIATEPAARRPERPWLVDMLIGLDRQLQHVERNLSYYFSPNTHLTGEALALYVVGSALPEMRRSERWVDTGRTILLRELGRQMLADGGHVERSTHYHRYTLDFYTLAALVAMRRGDAAAAGRFADAVGRLGEYLRTVATDQGRIPLIGDDDGGMLWPMCGADVSDVRASLTLAAAVARRPSLAPWGLQEEAYWVGWSTVRSGLEVLRQNAADSPCSRLLRESGYAVMRDRGGNHLIFDVGAHGYLNGGHAHADALSITLTVAGHPLLVDRGTATYTMDAALRDGLRSSACHNTLTLDGRSSSEPHGPFHWRRTADADVLAWRAHCGFCWAEAVHAGYAESTHRRNVVATPEGWLVVDEVVGGGRHRADVHWHFAPAWALRRDGSGRLRAALEDGTAVWALHDGEEDALVRGLPGSPIGWHSPRYGSLEPAWSARVTATGRAPFAVTTWLGPAAGEPPVLERLPLECDEGRHGIAVRIRSGRRRLLTLLRPGDAPDRDGRSVRIRDAHTDGRLLHCTIFDGQLQSLHLADGRRADAAGLTLRTDTPVSALSLSIEGDRLVAAAAASAPRLVLEGRVVDRTRVVTLNQRDCPVRRGHRPGVIIIEPGDWGGAQGDAPGVGPVAFSA